MSQHRCRRCGTSEKSGAAFRACYKYQSSQRCCGAEYCFTHSSKGKKCPSCSKGFLYHPSER